jgi:hypothetical protein
VTHRHRARLPRDQRLTRAARLVLHAAQAIIAGGAAAQLDALWGRYPLPRWIITVDLALLIVFCLEALTRARPAGGRT